jgi:uncharacterized phage protein (TIGR02216 family)
MTSPPPAFPWQTLIQFGIGEMGLYPEQFWQLTFAELIAMIESRHHTPLPSRDDLNALIALNQRNPS